MYGIKLWVARHAIDPGLNPILEKAVELDVPVLQHAWLKTTGNLPGDSFLSDVADSPNISVDTSGGDAESRMVETAVKTLGAKRVLFGSDALIRLLVGSCKGPGNRSAGNR